MIAERDTEAGEELSMSYVDVSVHENESPSEALARRQAELSRGWKINCTCSKCSEGSVVPQSEQTAEPSGDETKDETTVDAA